MASDEDNDDLEAQSEKGDDDLEEQSEGLADGSLDPDEVDPRVDPYDEGADDE